MMPEKEASDDLLIKYLDGSISQQELELLESSLSDDVALQLRLIEIAEQAVMIADIERVTHEQSSVISMHYENAAIPANAPRLQRPWSFILATVAFVLIAGSFAFLRESPEREIAQVREVTGVTHYFCSTGLDQETLQRGTILSAGDVIESRSCDAWITLDIAGGGTLTIAGNSSIRIQKSDEQELRFELQKGSLWISPGFSPNQRNSSRQQKGPKFRVETPTFLVQFQDALLNIQTSGSESIVRVNEGVAQVQRKLDFTVAETKAGNQTYVSLSKSAPLIAVEQPIPVNHWSSRQMKGSEVLLGNWLEGTDQVRSRLGAAPLLWPIPDREPVMLYAVAIAAWRCSEQPVVLRSDSKLVFRGRTQKSQSVRFGFSVQKMYGVFAGKFEVDVPANSLNQVEGYWQVDIPLSDFRSLHPHLAAAPDGFELTDVYALTIMEDAGLEIHQVELSKIPDPRAEQKEPQSD